jgi:hypothetical protein
MQYLFERNIQKEQKFVENDKFKKKIIENDKFKNIFSIVFKSYCIYHSQDTKCSPKLLHSLIHVQTFRIQCWSGVIYSFISTRNTMLLGNIEIAIHMKSTFSSDSNTLSNYVVINSN